mmetsp:Transcript_80843/g.168701  ORF Transcript_80843/g.168701 Transcript_80843/m.168701 type:complete len:211 (-) Transcript_80843:1067-1699(-)
MGDGVGVLGLRLLSLKKMLLLLLLGERLHAAAGSQACRRRSHNHLGLIHLALPVPLGPAGIVVAGLPPFAVRPAAVSLALPLQGACWLASGEVVGGLTRAFAIPTETEVVVLGPAVHHVADRDPLLSRPSLEKEGEVPRPTSHFPTSLAEDRQGRETATVSGRRRGVPDLNVHAIGKARVLVRLGPGARTANAKPVGGVAGVMAVQGPSR